MASVGTGFFILLLGVGLNEFVAQSSSSESPSEMPPPTNPEAAPVQPTSAPVSPSPLPSVVESASPPVALPAADPDQDYKAQVEQQLISVHERLGLGGYELTHEPYLGQLADNTQTSVTLTLAGEISYSIIGVCDNDCRDLDLALYDENGNLIDADEHPDGVPVVEVTPQWQGPFTVVVSMPNCTTSYCYYGLGTFGQ